MFKHNDIYIVDPTMSECGRFSVSPAYYGFEIDNQAGGFTAWIKRIDKGILVLGDTRGHSHNVENGYIYALFDDTTDYGNYGNLIEIISMREEEKNND